MNNTPPENLTWAEFDNQKRLNEYLARNGTSAGTAETACRLRSDRTAGPVA